MAWNSNSMWPREIDRTLVRTLCPCFSPACRFPGRKRGPFTGRKDGRRDYIWSRDRQAGLKLLSLATRQSLFRTISFFSFMVFWKTTFIVGLSGPMQTSDASCGSWRPNGRISRLNWNVFFFWVLKRRLAINVKRSVCREMLKHEYLKFETVIAWNKDGTDNYFWSRPGENND